MKNENLKGKVFGRWTVVESVNTLDTNEKFICDCDCGRRKEVYRVNLVTGRSKSCGCYRAQKTSEEGNSSHRKSHTRTYRAWQSMKARCDNPSTTGYQHYGERGISYDPDWKIFENFLRDMGEVPEKLSLERLDVNRSYYKDNCCWATRERQAQNKQNSIKVTLGNETKSLSEWAVHFKLTYSKAYRAYRNGTLTEILKKESKMF